MPKKTLLLHTTGIEVQELHKMLNDPGLMKEFEEGTATNFEKVVHTLNAYFVAKLSEPYERHVFRSMAQQERDSQPSIARLRKQVQKCNYVNSDFDIRDQVIDKC